MKSFANNLAFAHEDAADHGVGTREASAFARQLQRVFHESSGVSVHELVEGLVEKRVRVSFRVEGHHVVDLLAGADKTDGQSEFARDSNHDATFGRAI